LTLLSVITPLFNRSDLTGKFLRTMLGHLAFGVEVILVDNNSQDNTEEVASFYTSYTSKIKYIKLDRNYGFSKANNFGVAMATSDNLLFMSNDVEIRGELVLPIVHRLTDDCLVGHKYINFNSGWNFFNELDTPIYYLEGSLIGITRKTHHEIGGWDERFLIDYEDMDYCYRATRAGKKLVQLDLPTNHLFGQSSDPQKRLEITLDSQRKFCEKWHFTIKK